MPASKDWSDDLGALRRFALALVRDDRFAPDDVSACRLVDRLVLQTSVISVDAGPDRRLPGRLGSFARFVALHRRHLTKLAIEDVEGRWGEGASARGGAAPARAIRALPLELREPLLLVALAGFTHADAARVLALPLPRFHERLQRAHERFAAQLEAETGAATPAQRADAPHLRIIK